MKTQSTLPHPEGVGEGALYRKVSRRLLPLLFACYVVAYLDRVNVGFAKLQMLQDLRFSNTVYGLGAGIFFVGYFLFEVPSNLILHRVGARVWIARIMITWGLLSSAMMGVKSPAAFYLLRFLLGVAEAGFFPGIILYLTYWYPAARRAQITAVFMTAIAFSGIVGGPLSGWIMQTMAGVNGWSGWQWLFLLEGLPSIMMGGWVFYRLDDTIGSAGWLTEAEKNLLTRNIAAEARGKEDVPWWQILADRGVLLLAAVYFLLIMGLYGIGFWLPQLIRNAGVNAPLEVGFLSVIPYGFAAAGMIWLSRRSDRRGERRWHTAMGALAGAGGLAASGVWGGHLPVAMVALTVATAGILSTLPIFWTLPTSRLAGASAAAGIGLINSFGNLAGFASPFLMGYVQDLRGDPAWGLYGIALCLGLGAFLVVMGIPSQRTGAVAAAGGTATRPAAR